jgi:hypothetical protein
MKNLFTTIILSLTFHGCVMDSVYDCKIENNSAGKIQVNISFDKNYLDSIYYGKKHEYMSYLKKNIGQDSGVTMTIFDTLNLTANYEVLPRTKFTLEHGMFGPDYAMYKDIIIIAKDTLKLYDRREIVKAFKKIDGRYLLTIE